MIVFKRFIIIFKDNEVTLPLYLWPEFKIQSVSCGCLRLCASRCSAENLVKNLKDKPWQHAVLQRLK